MSKRSGSRSSRSERKAGRERAERARDHGLPESRQPALRVRASTPAPLSGSHDEDRSSDAPVIPLKTGGIPTLAKVLGGALVILFGVYLLSRWRDDALNETKPAAEPIAPAAAIPQPAPAASAP